MTMYPIMFSRSPSYTGIRVKPFLSTAFRASPTVVSAAERKHYGARGHDLLNLAVLKGNDVVNQADFHREKSAPL